MKTYDVIYETCPWHSRVALLNEQGLLISVRYDDETLKYVAGTVILGRVRKIMQGLNAAFVDIGDVVDGFLPLNKVPSDVGNVTEGMSVMVRIDRGRTEDKGARLNGNVIQEHPGTGVEVPSVIETAPSALERIIQDAGVNPIRVWITDGRTRTDVLPYINETQLFQLDQHDDVDLLECLDNQLANLNSNEFAIPGGGRLTIESTRALTSIDVDSAAVNMQDKTEMILDVNLRAAKEIARLCRVLNIGGSVVVDFISMKQKKHREEVKNYLINCFAEIDTRAVEVLNMSRFGLLELNREKWGEPLKDYISQPVFVAGDVLIKLWRQKADGYEKFVETNNEVADILKGRLTKEVSLAYLGSNVEVRDRVGLSSNEYSISN